MKIKIILSNCGEYKDIEFIDPPNSILTYGSRNK